MKFENTLLDGTSDIQMTYSYCWHTFMMVQLRKDLLVLLMSVQTDILMVYLNTCKM
jgi:hypothetical protein